MLFSEVLGSLARDGDSWGASVSPDWVQGRSLFGGLQAALALRTMQPLAAGLPLRVVQTTFIAPVPPGEFRIVASVLRSGKTTIHVEARILVGDATAVIVVGVFGKARASAISIAPRRRPVDRATPILLPDRPGAFPTFLQHFALRWLRGGPPGTGSPPHDPILEVDLHDSFPATEAHVLAIADATPPVALSMLKEIVPGSSLTWSIEMLREGGFDALPLSGWRLDVDVVAAGSGYTSQSEVVWGPGGEPVALSHQSMVVFG